MGHEIQGTQPTEPGWGMPPVQGLILGKGQPECHHLPQGIVQGLRVAEAFSYDVAAHGHSSTGLDFFPPVRLSGPLHLCMDPSAGILDWIQPLFGLDQDWGQHQPADGLAGTFCGPFLYRQGGTGCPDWEAAMGNPWAWE